MKVHFYFIAFLALLAVAYAANKECPKVDGEYVTHLPNPEDCSTFYKCLEGKPFLQKCPVNLEWNNELEVCDWPENAKCVVEKPTK